MVKIITDSSSNITQVEAKEMGIKVLPLGVIFGNDEYMDGVDILEDEFYEKLTQSKEAPHTSMLSMDIIERTFQEAKDNNETVILITISSKLSGTYDCANLVKNNGNFTNAYVYDSLGATVKTRILVDIALQNADKKPEDIIQILDKVRDKIELFAAVSTLEYLKKGGRLSKSGAMIGNMLSIKPIVTVTKEGEVAVKSKAVGFNNALKTIKKITDNYDIDNNYPIYFIYAQTDDNCNKLKALYPNSDKLPCVNLCAVIASHVGPGIAGICFVAK